jgi:tripartite-type tricarboxylate transporter receptor subunit TctC
MIRFVTALAATAAIATGMASAPASADAVADFYAGKTIRFTLGAGAGGGYHLYSQTLAEHMAKYVPGKPTIVIVNMPGAGGVKASNYVYTAAPRDGTTWLMPFWTHPVFQLIRPKGIKFDMNKMRWIGGMAALNSAVTTLSSAAKTIEDAKQKEIVVAASGKGSETYIFPQLLNSLIGTKFKIVTGYSGTRTMTVAMERGEAHGRGGSWQSWSAIRPEWHKEGKIRVLAQAGIKRLSAISYAPLISEIVKPEDVPVVNLLSVPVTMARIVGLPPGAPTDRLEALRKAFDATMKDPAFLAAAEKRRMDLDYMSGADVQKNIAELVRTPKPVLVRAAKALKY